MKYLLLAGALLCALFASDAQARQRTYAAHPDCNVLWPCQDVAPSPRGERVRKAMGGLGSARKVYMPKSGLLEHHRVGRPDARVRTGHRVSAKWRSDGGQLAGQRMTGITRAIDRPARYISGRLRCAVNVGAALAERGIKGTGSALALSYLRWGHSAGGPVPGAVIVSARRGGGHVAIVSRVENGVVYAWNATGGQRGWREIPYRHRVLDYRVPG